MRICSRVDEMSEVFEEADVALTGNTRGEMTVIIRCPNPHVPHEKRKSDHQCAYAPRSAEFKVCSGVHLGVCSDCFRRLVFGPFGDAIGRSIAMLSGSLVLLQFWRISFLCHWLYLGHHTLART